MFSKKFGNTVLMLKSVVSAFSQCKIIPELSFKSLHPISVQQSSSLKTTGVKYDLMEFFDKKDNWGVQEIRVGRSWRTEELRIKSNSDLHKLWFVLLKERNMLLTMEHECKEKLELFPNPERIDKVNESMNNLETVIRERNRAYFELETGHNGERNGKIFKNALGLNEFRVPREYFVPFFMNKKWRKDYYIDVHRGAAVRKFLKLYREKLSIAKRKQLVRERNHVMQILKRFPNIEEEAINKNFPNVKVAELRHNKRTLGHHENNEA